jgi:hypothetical protein
MSGDQDILNSVSFGPMKKAAPHTNDILPMVTHKDATPITILFRGGGPYKRKVVDTHPNLMS